MWIFGTDWFVSVVAHRTQPDMVLVRARLHDDLKRFLRLGYSKKKMPKIWADKNADYRFRALVPQAAVADMAQKAVQEIDYDNFKNEASKRSKINNEGPERGWALHSVWDAMFDLQEPRPRSRYSYAPAWSAFVEEETPEHFRDDDYFDDVWLQEDAQSYHIANITAVEREETK